MNQHGLPFHGLEQVGVDRVRHPCRHGAGHLQVVGGDFPSPAVPSHDDLADPLPKVRQVPGNGQNRHEFAGGGDLESRRHGIAVHLAAVSDVDVAQGLGAEIDGPLHLHPAGIQVETAEPQRLQLPVVVVPFVLHPGRQGHHGQVVGVGDGVQISGEPDREWGQGNALGEAAAGARPLEVEGGSAAGLTDGARHSLADPGQTLHQSDGGGGLSLSQRGGGNGRDVDVPPAGGAFEPFRDRPVIHLGESPAGGKQFIGSKAQLRTQSVDGLGRPFCRLGQLPACQLRGIQVRHRHGELSLLCTAMPSRDSRTSSDPQVFRMRS